MGVASVCEKNEYRFLTQSHSHHHCDWSSLCVRSMRKAKKKDSETPQSGHHGSECAFALQYRDNFEIKKKKKKKMNIFR